MDYQLSGIAFPSSEMRKIRKKGGNNETKEGKK